MVRITRPLFSNSASGRFADIGSFRMGRHGPEFIKQGGGGGKQPERQVRLEAEFAKAKAAHADSPTHPDKRQGAYVQIHDVAWPAFWRQWLIDNPVN